MKLVLLNLAMVVVALVVYDLLRGEPQASTERASVTRKREVDTVVLDERLKALEARGPARTDPLILERLAALEAALRDVAPEKEVPVHAAPEKKEPPKKSWDEPTKEEVRRFKRLQEAVRREQVVKKNWKRVEKGLAKVSVHLTKEQREQVHVAYAAFQPRVDEIWTEVKTEARATIEAGGRVDRATIVTSTMEIIQDEFAKTLEPIVNHTSDAEAIAEALHPGRK